jgi:HAD superfamily hydrolase (TIGR01490 family)
MSLAIFDLDNTLLRGDSDHAWGMFLVERQLVDGESYRRENERYYAQYQAGTLDIMEFLAFALAPLARFERATLDQWHREFMQAKILPMITPPARALVEQHRARGDTLLIITATNSFVTAPIGRAFGIDNLLATEAELVNDRYTGRVAGTPCYREGKVLRLREWLRQRHESLDDSWFYSDSHNDIPLLEAVTHPVAVNPDELLRDFARQRGWPIIQLD